MWIWAHIVLIFGYECQKGVRGSDFSGQPLDQRVGINLLLVAEMDSDLNRFNTWKAVSLKHGSDQLSGCLYESRQRDLTRNDHDCTRISYQSRSV